MARHVNSGFLCPQHAELKRCWVSLRAHGYKQTVLCDAQTLGPPSHKSPTVGTSQGWGNFPCPASRNRADRLTLVAITPKLTSEGEETVVPDFCMTEARLMGFLDSDMEAKTQGC